MHGRSRQAVGVGIAAADYVEIGANLQIAQQIWAPVTEPHDRCLDTPHV
jgi:hypothetical protein